MKVVNRVFYIDVTGLAPGDVASYMTSVKDSLAAPTTPEMLKALKEAGVWEDFFLPVRRNLHSDRAPQGVITKLWRWLFAAPDLDYSWVSLTRIEFHTFEVGLD